jgi:hypothetical protein
VIGCHALDINPIEKEFAMSLCIGRTRFASEFEAPLSAVLKAPEDFPDCTVRSSAKMERVAEQCDDAANR